MSGQAESNGENSFSDQHNDPQSMQFAIFAGAHTHGDFRFARPGGGTADDANVSTPWGLADHWRVPLHESRPPTGRCEMHCYRFNADSLEEVKSWISSRLGIPPEAQLIYYNKNNEAYRLEEGTNLAELPEAVRNIQSWPTHKGGVLKLLTLRPWIHPDRMTETQLKSWIKEHPHSIVYFKSARLVREADDRAMALKLADEFEKEMMDDNGTKKKEHLTQDAIFALFQPPRTIQCSIM